MTDRHELARRGRCPDCGDEYDRLAGHWRGSCSPPALDRRQRTLVAGLCLGSGHVGGNGANDHFQVPTRWRPFGRWVYAELEWLALRMVRVDDVRESGNQRAPERRESAESTPAGDTAAESPDARERPESTPDTASTIDRDALGLDADRRDAVQAMYEYLREHGTARKSDFTGDVYPEHPAGYGSAAGWWNALGAGSTTADSKGALADVAGVEKPPSGRPTWTYTGE